MAKLTSQQALALALQHHDAGRLQEAYTIYKLVLQQDPDNADILHLSGVVTYQLGRVDEAAELLARAVAHKPAIAEFHNNLALVLRDQGYLEDAIAACRKAIALDPDFAAAHFNLGNFLKEKAKQHGKEHGKVYLEDAIAAYQSAIALMPDFAEAHAALAGMIADRGQLDQAVVHYRQALAAKPDLYEVYNNLGWVYKDLGQLDDAIAAYRAAIALKPDYSGAHSNLILTLNYHPNSTPQSIFEESVRWARQHAEPMRKFIKPHANVRFPDRRLRIGYVSADFYNHVVALFLLPLLAAHDRTNFQIFCYANVLTPDLMTQRLSAYAEGWRDIGGLSDEQTADLIRQDGIDILVDLAGHTGGNRLLVFARKPAPVQVTWLGYPNTTGLSTIDYRLTDAYADPPGVSDTVHSEQLFRLPDTNWTYQPPKDTPAIKPAPLDAQSPITFGCFNNFTKVTEPMFKLWAEILAALPASKLFLKARALGAPSAQKRVRQIFQEHGIAGERLQLAGWQAQSGQYLDDYNRLHIALDPFPYHGTTTTCEALWMGVPVITLAGQSHVSRVGVSLLTNVGLSELIAQSPEDYVKIAIDLARDQARLAQMRSILRQRMQQSRLLDAPRFARNIETAYRHMWRTWCAEAR